MVIRSGKTAYSSTDRAFKAIDPKKLLGVILNDVKPMPFQTYYAYGYYQYGDNRMVYAGRWQAKNRTEEVSGFLAQAPRQQGMNVADEILFKRLLLLERRRAERAGSRFALMLVDMEELGSIVECRKQWNGVGQAIGASMRETDITGWYSNASVLGVILTTLNGAGRQTLETVVVERTRSALSRTRLLLRLSIFGSPATFFRTMRALDGWDKKAERRRCARITGERQSQTIERSKKDDGCLRQRHGVAAAVTLSS